MAEPQIVEVSVHCGGDGKVAIKDYGKLSSGFSANLSQKYAVPEGWTAEQALKFQLQKISELRDQVDAVLQVEFDSRLDLAEWK